jgi:hypothetical protein
MAAATRSEAAAPTAPCRIEIVEKKRRWPVLLVNCALTHHVRSVTTMPA